jgi:NAD(P)-dependent dehydrogenase (short-subunit alcohol dehydrogenase family)
MAASFRDHVVLITGASEGIGREMAIQLAREGARLVLASRNRERLRAAAEACTGLGARALAVPTDVAEQQACRELVAAAVKEFGRLDMCINNAGISMYAPFSAIDDPSLLEHILRVNFLGTVYCTSYALPHLKKTQGRIVAISSLLGKISAPGGSGYAASKHALRGFFDALRPEVRADKISVTVAYPGFIRTEIYKRFFDAKGQFAPDMSARIPAWAMMPVERCARRILQAARRRRREVPRTLLDVAILALNRLAPWLLHRFWLRTMVQDFPPVTGEEVDRLTIPFTRQ